jgi:spermidine synthase
VTTHGAQNRERPLGPLTYYFREGPAGQFFDILKDTPARGKRIGAIGLGVGVLAAYVTRDQRMTYYEIDPLDERIARDPRYFTYLKDAGDKVDVVIGDGRLSLGREPDGTFDALVVDAFSGDAIPAHLLTREAFALYFRKLKPDGLLLMHVTNAYLDLLPVVSRLVADAGLAARFSSGVVPTVTVEGEPSDWVVIARKNETIARFGWIPTPWQVLEPDAGVDLWTDDFTNIVQVMRWRGLGMDD